MGIFIDGSELGTGAEGIVKTIFLLIVYGFILSKSSALISDGSELLLLIPALAGIVGSVVLPVLGAVPDGAIVLFSGFGSKKEAQSQLSVGVGALAGSTIMLLTIPWALCIIQGRVDVVFGEANYKGKPKLTQGYSMRGTGITPRASIKKNGIIMIATAVSYLIIQGAAFGAHCDTKEEHGCHGGSERWWAFTALLICIFAFVAYLVYNVRHANDEDKEDFIAEVKKQAIESHVISLSAAFDKELGGYTTTSEKSLLLTSPPEEHERRFKETLKSFFHRYDKNGDGVIDALELKFLLKDVGEDMPEDKFLKFLAEIDTDNNGTISFPEFTVAMKRFITSKSDLGTSTGSMQRLSVQQIPHGEELAEKKEGGEEEEEEEEEEVPEDLANLPPDKQKMRILMRAGWMMGLGTIVTVIFSDPMVDMLDNLGKLCHINPFYIAFVLAPLASNASELIASINYATKKTKKTITISLGALEGAACMNNTFCLAIFLCLIFGRGLIWEFSAETISILLVEIFLFGFTLKKTHTVMDAIFIFSMYPLSIFVVWFLENVAKLD